MSPKASVIIPVYKAEKTLRRCVESLLLGQERDLEVILCEDHSPDGSWEVCLELQREFANVQAIRNGSNQGVSFTRNQGLAIARGEFLLFVDSDDWVSCRYAASLIGLAKRHPQKLCLCALHFLDKVDGASRDYTWEGESGSEAVVSNGRFYELFDAFLLPQLWNKIFRRDIVETAGIRFDESQNMGEDFQFVLDYMEALQCRSCAVFNEPLYYYIRWNRNSLMSQYGLRQNVQEYRRIERLHSLCGDGNPAVLERRLQQIRDNHVYHICRNRKLPLREKLTHLRRITGRKRVLDIWLRQQMQLAKENLAGCVGRMKDIPRRLQGRLLRRRREQKCAAARAEIQTAPVTILSQNCIGGVVYHDLGMQFLSPTINTFIPAQDFVRLALNIPYYMHQELQLRWEEEYPVGVLADVQIHFMHYETCREARESWNRRVQRINFEKILVLSTDRDGFDEKVYAQWQRISWPKVLFTANRSFTEDAVFFPEYAQNGSVGDLIPERKCYRDGKIAEKLNALSENMEEN